MVSLAYKILSKILANRLRRVLPAIILDNQFVFIEGWQILDGILVANEVVAWAKKNKSTADVVKD